MSASSSQPPAPDGDAPVIPPRRPELECIRIRVYAPHHKEAKANGWSDDPNFEKKYTKWCSFNDLQYGRNPEMVRYLARGESKYPLREMTVHADVERDRSKTAFVTYSHFMRVALEEVAAMRAGRIPSPKATPQAYADTVEAPVYRGGSEDDVVHWVVCLLLAELDIIVAGWGLARKLSEQSVKTDE